MPVLALVPRRMVCRFHMPSLHHRMRVQCLTSQQDNLQSVAHESGDLCSHMRVRVQEAGKGILPRF
jgi:hypothetical protein